MNTAAIRMVGIICLLVVTPPLLFAQKIYQNTGKALVLQKLTMDHSNAMTSERVLQQVVELDLKGVSVEQALIAIAEKADLKLMYSKSLLPKARQVTLSKRLITLHDALWSVLEGTGLRFALSQNRQLVLLKMYQIDSSIAQELITGQVTDAETGESLPGVNIIVKGASIGTATDIDGEYRLRVESLQDTLIFSFIGYQTREIPIDGRIEIDISMTLQTVSGEEIVVTALGRKKQERSLGYAVQKVEGESITKARESNAITSLTGKVAGLEIYNSTDFFQNPSIQLRGRSPLVVIDGVPNQSADIWKINPDDIEEISVLKGATASSLYGSIGRNGAIMITTKRGGNGLGVDFNSSTMFKPSFIVVPDVQTTYGAGFNGNYRYVDGSGGGPEGAGWIWGPKLDQKDPTTESGYWETPQYNSPVNPETGELEPLPWISRGENNIENFFRTGILSTNNLAVSWGGERGSFRVSATQTYQKGIVPNTDLQNATVSVSGAVDFTEKLTVDAALNYNKQSTDNFPEVGYGPQDYLYNLILWTGADVDVRDLRNYWKQGQEGVQQRHYNNSWYNNPYFQAYEYQRGYYKDNVFGSFRMDYDFTSSLSARLQAGMNIYGLSRSTEEPKSYIGYGEKSKGNYYLQNTNYYDTNADLALTYEQSFSQDLSVSGELGGSVSYQSDTYRSLNTDGLVIPEFYNLSNSANPLNGSNSFQEEQRLSAYGVIDLNYRDTYYLSITGRNDWVSTMPVRNNHYFYPSVSGAVIVSEIIDMPVWLYQTKVRGSWSRVSIGRIDDYPYSHLQTYNTGVKWNSIPSLYRSGQLINPDLHPETSDTWEVGLDLGFLQGRLGLDLTYYQARDYNNITSITVSGTSGFNSRLVNGNEYTRKGVEIILSATPVMTSTFMWNLATNLSQYRRYLTGIYGNEERLGNLRVGDRTDKIYASVYAENSEGKIIYESNGMPQWDPFTRFIGYNEPDWIFGVQNTFTHKDFSLNISVDGRIGGLMYSTTNQKMWWGGTHPGTVNHYRDEANAGKATYIGDGVVVTGGSVQYDADGNIIEDTRTYSPNERAVNYISFMTNTSNSHNHNYHYYDETFLKLRELSLTYNLPQNLLQRLSLQSASISLIGRNLLLLAKIPNTDPDPGYDDLNAPGVRSIGFNINLKY